jgi:hypothetical protein
VSLSGKARSFAIRSFLFLFSLNALLLIFLKQAKLFRRVSAHGLGSDYTPFTFFQKVITDNA